MWEGPGGAGVFLVPSQSLHAKTSPPAKIEGDRWGRENVPPMLINPTTQGNLLANFCARRSGQHNLCKISLNRQDPASRRRGPDIDHEHFILGEFLHFRLFAVVGLDA